MNMDGFSAILRFLLDNFLCVWMFRGLPNKKPPFSVLAFLFLLISVPLYFPLSSDLFLDSALARFALRAISVAFYLSLAKERSKETLLYISLYYSLCLTTCQNLFMVPPLSQLRNEDLFPISNPWFSLLAARSIEYLVIVSIMLIINRVVSMDSIQETNPIRYISCLGLAAIQIYIRNSFRQAIQTETVLEPV